MKHCLPFSNVGHILVTGLSCLSAHVTDLAMRKKKEKKNPRMPPPIAPVTVAHATKISSHLCWAICGDNPALEINMEQSNDLNRSPNQMQNDIAG